MKQLFLILVMLSVIYGTESIVLSLFPNSYELVSDNSSIIGPIELHNMRGFIPTDKIKSIVLNDSITVVAGMIYLEDSELPFQQIALDGNRDNQRELLLQVILWNRKTEQFVTKPSGFPLISDAWSCYGDVCLVKMISSLSRIDTVDNLFRMNFSYGIDDSYTMLFKYDNGNVQHSSPVPVGGYTDWSIDEEFSITYSDFVEAGDRIRCLKTTTGNSYDFSEPLEIMFTDETSTR